MLSSCFGHVVELASGAVLTACSPLKKRCQGKTEVEVPIVPPVANSMEEEDTEEGVAELREEVEQAEGGGDEDTRRKVVVAKLLLKVRGIIAKVSSYLLV